MSNYQPGEIVDVTIRGRILPPKYEGEPLQVAYHEVSPGVQATIEIRHPDAGSVTVERVAPPEWPPRPGDLWRDSAGRVWFGIDTTDYDDSDGIRVEMASPDQYAFGRNLPDEVNRRYGPMTLVHREDADRERDESRAEALP